MSPPSRRPHPPSAASRPLPVRFLVTREGRAPIRKLVQTCDGGLGVDVDLRLYSAALGPARPPSQRRTARLIDGARAARGWLRRRRVIGTGGRWRPRVLVFADIERLSWDERRRAAALWSRLESAPGVHRILNHPTRSLCRYELLRALARRGWNDFDVYRLSEGRMPARYPVFLRNEDDHGGATTSLLRSPGELEAAVEQHRAEERLRDGTLIVEYCDTTAADGLTRKYGALRVGPHILPRHVFIGRGWMLKSTTDSDGVPREEMARIERAYMADNPHAAQLMARFELAGIEYGRIDYGVRGGRVQVWEINTNPTVFLPAHFQDPVRGPLHRAFAARLRDALSDLGMASRAADRDASGP